jgi:RimJ/RimL family protein N-acetyltransferase
MRTFDVAFITRVMTHKRVWDHVSDDLSGEREDFAPILHEYLYYLAPEHDGQQIGVFFLHPHNGVTFEIHTCILPQFWGQPALTGAQDAFRWMVGNTSCRKIITHVPANNTVALRFAVKAGMVHEGLNRQSYLKGGTLLDQDVLGITEGEIKCL